MRTKILIIILFSLNIYAQTPRAGGINNSQATLLNIVHDNFTGVQSANSNAFAVYSMSTNFDYYLGLKNTDNIAEGSTNKYFSNTLARNAFSAGSGLVYSAGNYSLDSSSQGVLASVANKFNIPTGTTFQYLNGLGTPVTFPTIPNPQINSDWNSSTGISQILNKPIIPTNTNQLTNGSGYLTTVPAQSFTSLTGKPTTLSGYGIVDSYPLTGNPSNFLTNITSSQINTALGFTPVSNVRTITINGITQDLSSDRTWNVGDVTNTNLTSSLATKENTISSGTISQYWRGDKTWQILDKTSVGLSNIDNTSDLNKPISTATQTALNTKQATLVSATNIKTINGSSLLGSGDLAIGNTYTSGTGISIASNVITNTAPDQTVTLTAGNRISVTGTYPNFTISYIEPTINTPAVRTLNSNFTISTTKQATVSYSVTCSVTNPLLIGTSTAMSYLEYSTNAGSSWLLPAQNGNSSGVGITVTLQLTNGQTGTLVGVIPANALVRLRTVTTGTASVTYVTGTEIY